jgi:hypothetical protein
MTTRIFLCSIGAAVILTMLTGCTPTAYMIAAAVDPPRTELSTLSISAAPVVPEGRQDTSYVFTQIDLAKILRSTAPPNGQHVEVSTIGGILKGTALVGDTVYAIARGPSLNARHGLLPGDTVDITLRDSVLRLVRGKVTWFDGRTIDLEDQRGVHRHRVWEIETIHLADGRVIERDYLLPAKHSRNLYWVPGLIVDPGKSNVFVPLHSVKKVWADFTQRVPGSARWVAAGIGGAMDLAMGVAIMANDDFAGTEKPIGFLPISLLAFGALVLLIE